MVFEKGQHPYPRLVRGRHIRPGGSVINLTSNDSQLGRSDYIEDTARVISRMVDIVMIRTFEQTRIERFASHSRARDRRPDQRIPPLPDPGEHRLLYIGTAAPSPARRSPGSATPTTWPTPGCKPPKCSASRCSTPAGYEARRHLHRQAVGKVRQFKDPMQACQARTWSPPTSGPTGLRGRENEERRAAFADWYVDTAR